MYALIEREKDYQRCPFFIRCFKISYAEIMKVLIYYVLSMDWVGAYVRAVLVLDYFSQRDLHNG
jgi:hypothetical protein